ncbi:MAG: peptide chain release factor N(5)-glutamine methyltransferase [Mycoplasmoidaceae bacterium]|nr:MAG: peptide chain release factor N(5)-glutamine methyltransferase [Mycoplasmoidaceae bacterium]
MDVRFVSGAPKFIMTYIELINECKQKYCDTTNYIYYELLFFVSKIVKNKTDFAFNGKKNIDFNANKYFKYLNRYYKDNEPLGSIIGFIKFCGLNLKIDKDILVPRDETEELVKLAIPIIKKHKITSLYDLCCGTGNIGLAIKNSIPSISITCIDINKKAILNTKRNAKLNNIKINVICGDFYKSIKTKADCIICNPPYVDKNDLNKEMIKYESKISFSNSESSLSFYEKLISNVDLILNKKFLLIFEIGYNQKKDITKILKRNDLYKNSKFYKDSYNVDRFLIINTY